MKPSEKLKLVKGKKFSLFLHILGRILDEMDSRLKTLEADYSNKKGKP